MITCNQCRKVTGEGEVGKGWICEDCREELNRVQSEQQGVIASDEAGGPADNQ